MSAQNRPHTPNILPAPRPLPRFLPDAPREPASIAEPARRVPVLAECDVAVLGGGPAGVCAAVAAARAGARTIIVERHAYFGGMATAANVNIWHSLWSQTFEQQVIGGLAQEILDRLEAIGAMRNNRPDGRGMYTICSESTKLCYDDMIVGSGVRVLLHAWLAGAATDEHGNITAAILETKSGRGALRAKVFIDATGDADLCARAGAPTNVGDAAGLCQPPSLCFRVGGIDFKKAEDAGVNTRTIQAELFKGTMDYNGGKYPTFLWGTKSVWRKDEYMFAGVRVPGVVCSKWDDFTRAEIEGRYQLRWVMENLRRFPGYENCSLVDIGAQIGVRETRRIEGEYTVQEHELLEGHRFHDTIAQGTYPVDIHNPTGPGIVFRKLDGTEYEVLGDGTGIGRRWDGQPEGAPKKTTPCYCVPYRSLIPKGLKNVLAAGRCVSATHEAAGALRVMINAMSFGHAAGAAAAQAVARHGGAVREVDAAALREHLIRDGVPLLPVEQPVGAAG
ncbi:MAG: FAD-dependent oxidoreductase [Planctomycetes bacterium]|nr:FAD-dependent oxidoreductase [Planctomycetota bacterium]